MTRNLAFALAAATLLSGCSSMGDVDGLFGYPPAQPGAVSQISSPTVAVLPLPQAPARGTNRSAAAPRPAASRPALRTAALPVAAPAPDAPVAAAPLPALAPAPAAAVAATAPRSPAPEPSAVPTLASEIEAAEPSVSAPVAAPAVAAISGDEERDRMVASALEPAANSESLADLRVSSSGTMILPRARDLDVIDIAPIRDSFQNASAEPR